MGKLNYPTLHLDAWELEHRCLPLHWYDVTDRDLQYCGLAIITFLRIEYL